jgi:hypothetical protein
MKLSLASIPAAYYGAIAAAILLLAWSVDNLIQKRIAATQRVLSEFQSAELQANYQRSTLHYIADIRALLNDITPDFPGDTPFDPDIPMEFQSINSGRIKIATDATLRMQDFRLAAEIRAGIFDGIDLPDDIQNGLNQAVSEWSDYTSSLSKQLGVINEFVQSVMLRRFGGRPPTFEEFRALQDTEDKPAREDTEKLDALFAEFWETFQAKGSTLSEWDQEITTATNRAALFVGKRQRQLHLVSRMISITYIGLFLIGSVVSVIAAIKRGAS